MPTRFCPHCGERIGFTVKFNVSCRIDGVEEKGYMRLCKLCGGRFITIRSDELQNTSDKDSAPGLP